MLKVRKVCQAQPAPLVRKERQARPELRDRLGRKDYRAHKGCKANRDCKAHKDSPVHPGLPVQLVRLDQPVPRDLLDLLDRREAVALARL